MINLMLKPNGQYAICLDLCFHSFWRQPLHTDLFFPLYFFQTIRDTQTSFFMIDLTFFRNDLRVNQGEEAVLGVHRTDIENDYSSGNPDLTGGQSHAPRGV